MPDLTEADDKLYWTKPGSDIFRGLGGNDSITVKVSLRDRPLEAGSSDILDGGDGNDTLTADVTNDTLLGGAGLDTLNGGDGNDLMDGGADDDSLLGGSGHDRMFGGTGVDVLSAGAGDDLMDGGDGNDTLVGSTGKNVMDGGDGNDTVMGSTDAEKLNGGDGDDYLSGGSGNDVFEDDLWGSILAGHPTFAESWLDRGLGNDTILGGAGQDLIYAGLGADYTDGGTEVDTVSYRYTGAVTIDLATGATAGDATGDTFANVEIFIGSSLNDTLIGNDLGQQLEGGAGDDRIEGGGGNDILLGNEGADLIFGGAGADFVDGGSGSDTVTFADSTESVTINLSLTDQSANAGAALGDRYYNIDVVIGSGLNDVLIGNEFANRLEGGVGDDRLEGGGDNDILIGGAGADTVDGGEGTGDVVTFSTASESVTINLSNQALNAGAAAGDTYQNVETFVGSALNDSLTGDSLANTFDGGAGDDFFFAGDNDGADTFTGGDGFDVVSYAASAAGVSTQVVTSTSPGTVLQPTTNALTGLPSGAAGDRISTSVEGVIGGSGRDLLVGSSGSQYFAGGAGNDQLLGGSNADTLVETSGTNRMAGDGNGAADPATNLPAGTVIGRDTFVSLGGTNLLTDYAWQTAGGQWADSLRIAGLGLMSEQLFTTTSFNPGGPSEWAYRYYSSDLSHQVWIRLGIQSVTGTSDDTLAVSRAALVDARTFDTTADDWLV